MIHIHMQMLAEIRLTISEFMSTDSDRCSPTGNVIEQSK